MYGSSETILHTYAARSWSMEHLRTQADHKAIHLVGGCRPKVMNLDEPWRITSCSALKTSAVAQMRSELARSAVRERRSGKRSTPSVVDRVTSVGDVYRNDTHHFPTLSE